MSINSEKILENTTRINVITDKLANSKFSDVSDTTATASDVAIGKVFYDAQGVKTEGTYEGENNGDIPDNLYTNNVDGLYSNGSTSYLILDGYVYNEGIKASYTIDKNIITVAGTNGTLQFTYDSYNQTISLLGVIYSKQELAVARPFTKQIIGTWSNDSSSFEFGYNGVCKVTQNSTTHTCSYFVKDGFVVVEDTASNIYYGFIYLIENEVEYLDMSVMRIQKETSNTHPIGCYRTIGHVLFVTANYVIYDSEKVESYTYENNVLTFTNSNGSVSFKYDCVLDAFVNDSTTLIRDESAATDIPENVVLGEWENTGMGMLFTLKESNVAEVAMDGETMTGTYELNKNYVIVNMNGFYSIFDYDLVDFQETLIETMGNVTLYKKESESGGSGSGTDMLQARVDATNSCKYLFYHYAGDNVDYISGLDTSKVTDMSCMFEYSQKLKTIPLIDTSSATDMTRMFSECHALTEIPQLDTSKVTNMYYMFYNCNALIEIPQLDTSNVENMSYMFEYVPITTIPQLDTSKVTNMYGTFYGCKKLTTIPQLDTSKVTNMGHMFYICDALTEIPQLDTSNVENMYYTFYQCKALTEIPQLDLSNVASMEYMLGWCTALTTVSLINTSNVTNMRYAFYYDNNLTTVGVLDLINADPSYMFTDCKKLTNLTVKNVKKNLQIGSGAYWGHLLTLDSLLNTIKELWDITSGTQQTLTVGSANLEKLASVYVKLVDITDEMRAEDEYIDNKKPFVVCESTDEGAMTINDYVFLKNWVIA